jgi:hypothetical protein
VRKLHFARMFYMFRRGWIELGTDVHNNLLSDYEFRKNRLSRNRTLLRGVNE